LSETETTGNKQALLKEENDLSIEIIDNVLNQVIGIVTKASLVDEASRDKAQRALSNAEAVGTFLKAKLIEADALKHEALFAKEQAQDAEQLAITALTNARIATQEALVSQDRAQIAEERYKFVLEGSDDGFWDWDLQTKSIYWNGRFFKMLGFTEIEGVPPEEALYHLVHPEDRERLKETIQSSLLITKHFEASFRVMHSDDSYLYCLARGQTISDKYGIPVRMAGTITDITERILLQKEVQQARELAETANKRKSQVLGYVAHELKNPLNAVMIYAQMLNKNKAEVLDEEQRQYITNILMGGSDLRNLLNDVLDIASIEAGKLAIKLEEIQVEPLLSNIKMVVYEIAKQDTIQFDYECQHGIDVMIADPKRLRQILINLLINAIKYTNVGGKILLTLRLSEDGKHYIWQVIDNGIGISEEELAKLFTEFYRINNKFSSHSEGIGLGLALTKQIAESLQGDVSVESKVGVGSTFTIRLPVIETLSQIALGTNEEAAAL
jgi:PAS domain S-box-containing protein